MTASFTDTPALNRPHSGTALLSASRTRWDGWGETALKASAASWFVVAVIGQWIFAFYVAAFYGGAALAGDPAAWNQTLPHGYIPGDTVGNAAVAAHLFLAVVILVGGPLQFVPQLRSRLPVIHRWNGRLYLTTALITGLSGFYMVWTRGTVGGPAGNITISINALLIAVFAFMVLNRVLSGDIKAHRRWALRLFMVVNGVWFFRVGLMLWLFINGGPVGFDPETFRGPFLVFLGVAQYALPLAVLEIYFRARDHGRAAGRLATAAGLTAVTLATGTGIFAATAGMWLPRL